jgi:hypothetical protein
MWQIIYRTGQEEYATKEILITDAQYLRVQEELANGNDFIILKDKPTIKRTSIASINKADDIISEYQRNGVTFDGLPAIKAPEEPKQIGKSESVKEMIARKSKEIKKKMGWDN